MHGKSTRSSNTALVVAPLPMAFATAAFEVFMSDSSPGIIVFGFAVVGYAFVLLPLLVSKGFLYLTSWRSRRAHLWVMFIVTFIPMLSIYRFVEFETDMSFSYEVNDGGTQVIEFAIAGVLLAAFMAFLNAVSMLLFWHLAVRANGRAGGVR